MGLLGSCCGDTITSFAAMVALQIGVVVLDTLSKAAMLRGMNRYVFVVYYNALGTLILLSFFFFQSSRRPPLTFSLLCRFFLLGLIRSVAVISGFTGLDYSSPTLATALSNLVPTFTFILAIIFRMEKFDIRSRSSQAKFLGTIISITGALIVTLYKGQAIIVTQSPHLNHQLVLQSPKSNWVIGGLFLAADWLLASIWGIVQTAVVRQYPEELTIAFFCSFFTTSSSAIFTLIAERDLRIWRLRPDIELISVVYSAIVGTVLGTVVYTWCLRIKGPIFVAIFKPFGIVIAVIMSVGFLGDTLYIGNVIGSIVITIGFCGVIWGKSKEEKANEGIDINRLDLSPDVPLLVNISEEDNKMAFKREGGRK